MTPRLHLVTQAVIVAIATVASIALYVFRQAPETNVWKLGSKVRASITLVTSDRHDLDCAFPTALPTGSCAYRTPTEVANKSDAPWLDPYVTVDHVMLLLPDLFELPDVRRRYDDEPPGTRPRKQLKRFTVRCVVELVDRPKDVRVRFGKKDPFSKPMEAWVGKVQTCKVEG